jgi:hypothetical protein
MGHSPRLKVNRDREAGCASGSRSGTLQSFNILILKAPEVTPVGNV